MRYKLVLIVLIFSIISCQSTKQITSGSSDDILMTVGNSPVKVGEFEYAYLKNNHLDSVKKDKRSDIEEYLELYKNFKLKVIEAEALGRDTTTSFLSEFKTYEKQLAEPYLAISKVSDLQIKEGYERMKEEISASHILITLSENASPVDTLQAYDKAVSIRNRIINGESFEDVAKQESQDPSARQNGGYLGYFTAGQMVLPFEIAAYNTIKGEISQPVKTRFGYHLIFVKDRIPTRDEVKVAHIMLKNDPNGDSTTVINKINSIYEELVQGEAWRTLCLSFSDDTYTKEKGGELPFIRPGRIDPDFEEEAFKLTKIGSYSQPFKTRYGWHIVKLIDKKVSVNSFEESKSQIEQNLSRYGKFLNKKKAAISLLKKENLYKSNNEVTDKCKSDIIKSSEAIDGEKTIFSFDGREFSCTEFQQYVVKSKPFDTLSSESINTLYENFENESLLKYEKNVLLAKNDDYKYLHQEYRDGILLFSIMEDSVWDKASTDTTGIKNYFSENKSKYPRLESAEVIHISTKNKGTLDSLLEAYKLAGPDSLFALRNKYNIIDPLSTKVVKKTVEKGSDVHVDDNWAVGITTYEENNRLHALCIKEIVPAGYKELNSIRGKVISDYQNHVESLWIQQLRSKHPISLDKKVLEALIKKISNEDS